ncbi:hypothetical protein NC651_018823 [Populus alba x Populus x berolinensis]|nr:hypothetical protein NC651_018823 [Populus alba x Populus x berolinensis]
MKNNKTWESRFLGYKILVSNLLLLLSELKMKRKMGQVFGFITNRMMQDKAQVVVLGWLIGGGVVVLSA